MAAKHSITRRNFVHALSAAGTVAGLGVAPAFAASADAEIIQLAEKILAACDFLDPAKDRAEKIEAAWEYTTGGRPSFDSVEAWSANRRACGVEAEWNRVEEMFEAISPDEIRLFKLRPVTLEGLAAQAKVLRRHSAPWFWKASDEDADWDHLATRGVIDGLIALTSPNI